VLERGDDAIIAVDVGGTSIRAAAFLASGALTLRRSLPVRPESSTPLEQVRTLVREVDQLARGARCRPVGVSLAVPGVVDHKRGIVVSAVNLSWNDLPIGEILAAESDLPVSVTQDARAGVLAEHAFSTAEEGRDLALIPIGTGISAGLMMNGSTLAGNSGAAGEFGHIPVVRDGRSCTCSQRGCVEAYCSGSSIANRYRELTGSWLAPAAIARRLTYDSVADLVWQDAVSALAKGVAALVSIVDPSCIAIGGGLSLSGQKLHHPLLVALARELPWRAVPPVRLAHTLNHAPLIGAALSSIPPARRRAFAQVALRELLRAA
jgi:glucokinase